MATINPLCPNCKKPLTIYTKVEDEQFSYKTLKCKCGFVSDVHEPKSLIDMKPSAKGFHDISITKDGQKLDLMDRFLGGIGINTDQNSVLVRPYRTAIEKGKPIGSIKHILVREGDVYYVLGIFDTTRKHLVFFPGTAARMLARSPGPQIKEGANPTDELIVDHLTLESDLKSWHIKMSSREIKYHAMGSGKVNDSFYLWFQMQVSSLNQLESLPYENHIHLNIDPNRASDLYRLLHLMKNSRDREIPVIPFNEKVSEENFWAFQFFTTKSMGAILPQVPRVNVNRPPYVIVDNHQTGKQETRTHVKLDGFGSIWIRVYKVNGTMPSDCFMISGQELEGLIKTDKRT
jgi:hypothetical protein